MDIKKEFPKKVTKKLLVEMYKPMSRRMVLYTVNYYEIMLGKNKLSKNIPNEILLFFIRDYGFPDDYYLPEDIRTKLKKIQRNNS
ncbi:hypothetical protein [Flavobacterium macrobrachii]|uniref:Uncharacterized protein n=1 Tax=Flavobacterium macrobrachii TaxID=591204 RepID=A0ABS2CVN1_9FLAO|nr:hypothetical protein [Flavobacterium macrobrachii]MBM6498990.1 hypothetical protein [Flavobacterium macrobrachii]